MDSRAIRIEWTTMAEIYDKITSEQKMILEALQIYFGKKENISEEFFDAVDYDQLILEMKRQGIYIVVVDVLRKQKDRIPQKIWNELERKYFVGVSKNTKQAINEADLFRTMEEAGKDYVVIKGVAAGEYYHQVEERLSGDCDFLIRERDKEELHSFLLKDGYRDLDLNNGVHEVFSKDKFRYEMHEEIPGIPFGEPGEKIRGFMKNIFENSHQIQAFDQTFRTPDAAYHFVIIILHMVHHMMNEGIGLRHLMDLACFIEKTETESFWQDQILPLMKDVGLLSFVKGMACACQVTFKIDLPEFLQGTEESLGEQIMKDLLDSGDFGEKNRMRAQSGMMISQHGKRGTNHGKIINLAYFLHDTTVTVYPIVKKIKVLHPVLDVYRGIKYLGKAATGKSRHLLKAGKYVEERKEVYEHLHIFEVEK